MLNKKAIFEALNRRPLCHGALIHQAGMSIEYCAMGAIAADVGATNEYLKNADQGGVDIWRDYGAAITAKFGIETLQQFQSLMKVNDAEQFSTRRNKKVAEHIEAMSPDEVNSLINECVVEEKATVDVKSKLVEHFDNPSRFMPDE